MYWFFYLCASNAKVYRKAVICGDIEKFEIFGFDYIMQSIQDITADIIYRKYIADSFANITEAIFAIRGQQANVNRYVDLYEPPKPVDKRTADDIIADVNRKCGLTMINDEEGEEE